MSTLGPFSLVRPLGSGGQGEVWLAAHRQTGVEVALKGLSRSEDELRSEFLREVRLVAGLRHRNVVLALDAGEVPPGLQAPWPVGAPWFAMELAACSLADRRPMDWAETAVVLEQVLAGLAHAHAHGVVHRDVKPHNILSIADRWVVADFGIGASRFGTGERRGAGTPEYMAPEQVAGRAELQGPATDLYAVGCLAWELVTGAPPFTGADRQQVARRHLTDALPPWAPQFRVPASFTDWLGGLLARRPEERFPSAAAARATLVALERGPSLPARAPTVVPLAPTVANLLTASIDDAPWRDPTGEELRPLASSVGSCPPPPLDAPSEDPALVGVGLGLVQLREPPLVGRETERAALWTALSATVRDRRARVVVLRGAPGVGTSRLAAWVARGCAEVGLGPWVGLAGGKDVGASVIEALVRQEPRLRVLPSARIRGPLEGAAVALLREGARAGAAVVWCDDGRDAAGRSFVRQLVQSAEPVPALIVVVLSEGPGAAVAELELDELSRWAPIDTLRVEPLPMVQHQLLVASVVGLDGGLARLIEGPTMGSPGAVVRLVRHLAGSSSLVPGGRGLVLVPGAVVTFPTSSDAALAVRVDRLVLHSGEAAGWLLEAAAVSGARVARGRLLELGRRLGVAEPFAAAQVAAADWIWVADGDGWLFTDPGVRQGLLRRAEAAGRLIGHHRLCLESSDADPEPVAHFEHAYAAREWSLAYLAGCRVLSMYLGRGDTRIDAILRQTQEALEHLEVPADHRWWWQLRFFWTWHADRRGDPVPVHQQYAAIAAVARREGWAELEANVLRRAGRAHVDAPELALPMFERAEALFRSIGDLPRAGECAGARADALVWRDASAAASGFRMLRELRPESSGGHVGLAILALLGGRLEEADRRLSELPAEPTTWVTAQVGNLRGEVERRRGALDAAELHYRRSAALYLALDNPTAAYPILNLALVHLRRGHRPDALRLAQRVLTSAPGRELELRAHAIRLAAGTEDPGSSLSRMEALLQGRPVLDTDVRELLQAASRELPPEAATWCLRLGAGRSEGS